jgi:Rps23 Pro-64 3,4-dihydroxylase Tpa1-like proline 4-hydroxylase
METENTELQWYWLGCTSGHKELKVRDEARNYGLEAFVPLKYAYKNVRKQTQRTLVPAIAGLMFVRGTEEQVKDFIDGAKERLYMRKSTYSNHEEYLVIPDRAMMNFIAATEDHDKKIDDILRFKEYILSHALASWWINQRDEPYAKLVQDWRDEGEPELSDF